jgi:hypothetical protein
MATLPSFAALRKLSFALALMAWPLLTGCGDESRAAPGWQLSGAGHSIQEPAAWTL